MTFHSLLHTAFGQQSAQHLPHLHSLHLYCLLVVCLVIALCAYTVRHYRLECDQSFAERVKVLRLKYAAGRP